MRALLADSGLPPGPHPAVQIGGSKGKGTTCAFLEALARAAGLLSGVYSSPHLVTLLERVRIGGENVELGRLERLLRQAVATDCGDRRPTFFEAMTAAAAAAFAERGVELAIYEVGLGGRFDATTALDVDASIVTTIELEHTEILGDTVELIAAEKAAIVRPGGVGFTAARGAALATIAAHATAVGARLAVLGRDFDHGEPEFGDDGACRFLLRFPDGVEQRVTLPAARAFEVPALALAAVALRHLLPTAPLVLDPAPRPLLPARFEIFDEPDGEVLALDGAHTEESLRAVAAELARRFPGRKAALLFAAAAGKRWREGLSALLPRVDNAVVTGLVGTPGEDPAAIASWLAARGIASETAADVESGLAALRRRPGPRLVAGSFYLAGAVRELVHDRATTR